MGRQRNLRVRWGSVARAAGAALALIAVVGWPRLSAREPTLPPEVATPVVVAPAAIAPEASSGAPRDASEPERQAWDESAEEPRTTGAQRWRRAEKRRRGSAQRRREQRGRRAPRRRRASEQRRPARPPPAVVTAPAPAPAPEFGFER